MCFRDMLYAISRTFDFGSTEMVCATENNFLKRLLALAAVFFFFFLLELILFAKGEKIERQRKRERSEDEAKNGCLRCPQLAENCTKFNLLMEGRLPPLIHDGS